MGASIVSAQARKQRMGKSPRGSRQRPEDVIYTPMYTPTPAECEAVASLLARRGASDLADVLGLTGVVA